MSDREELEALRRLAELEAKAGGAPAAPARPPMEPPNMLERGLARFPSALMLSPENERAVRGFLMGGADPSVGLAQLAYNAAGQGEGINRAIAAKEAEYQGTRGEDAGFDWARLGGNVVGMIAPTGRVSVPSSLGGKVATGAGLGLLGGSMSPVTDGGADYTSTKLSQQGKGLALGAGASAVGSAAGWLWPRIQESADLMLPGGPARIFDRYLRSKLGEQGYKEAAEAAANVKQLVPGNAPTTAEAVAHLPSASPILAHQKIVAQTPGGISGKFGERVLEQQAANVAHLGKVAGTPEQLEQAIAQRSANSARRYGEAYAQAVRADPELARIASDPFFKKSLPTAFDLAKSKGIDPSKDLTRFLHYVKVGLDKQLLPEAKNSLASTEQEAIAGVRERLVSWMGRKNPLYEAARSGHAADSQPINAMQVGQSLGRKLINPSGKETPGAFLNAIADEERLVKSATGRPYPVFTPEQRAIVDEVARAQERKLASVNPVQKTDLQGGVNVADETRLHLPNLLYRPAMLANWAMKGLAGKGSGIEGKVDAIAAQQYLNPAEFAAARKLTPAQQAALDTIMERMKAAGIVSTTLGLGRETQ